MKFTACLNETNKAAYCLGGSISDLCPPSARKIIQEPTNFKHM